MNNSKILFIKPFEKVGDAVLTTAEIFGEISIFMAKTETHLRH